MGSKAIGLLLGKCVPSVKTNASKICVTKLELDENLLMYFKNLSFLYADDPGRVCKTGDIVLVEELPQKMSKLVTHRVKKVVYPMGDVTDPITGEKVVSSTFRKDIGEISQLVGKNEQSFDYDSAPARGWQEGKKDFTNKKTYIKYHEVPGQDDPYAL
ncbi:28S ribosomal protein S17, mitochondrial [Cimex lectularius]|uniref:Mitochondrial ribosomal protein S17 n=1 Tax=Cimex lectularius TaxID=79782 RepID=A0A8I6RTJ4_CIMLE|nr:28S ribosomal protein S17, mitochondrial [Cimex lectularius]